MHSLQFGSQTILALCLSSGLKEMDCVRAAQSSVAQSVRASGGTSELQRLANADLFESALARAVPVIEAAPQYLKLAEPTLREKFLSLHLEVLLIRWLRERTTETHSLETLTAVEKTSISARR